MSSPFDAKSPEPQSMAAGKVNGPATALLVIGAINVVLSLFGIVQNVMYLVNPPQAIDQAPPVEGFDPQMMMKFVQGAGAVGIVMNFIAIGIAVVIVMGALKMKKLESWGMAVAAAALAMIPSCLPAVSWGSPSASGRSSS
jgi:hypothetical protein